MAILQIAKVQHRRGLQEDLPQPLSSAELGWCIDTQRLFIGNGLPGDPTTTNGEGAPRVGNTEILTEHSDIFGVAGSYIFKGLAAGYQVQTGQSLSNPTARTLQDKLDDFVNIRDFGAVGDGITNDVAAFNRAITQLYKATILEAQPLVRRTLYLPAGNYKLSGDFIRMLPYVKLKGDGKRATYITQTDTNQPCVLSSCDSKGHTGFMYGAIDSTTVGFNSAIMPRGIELEDITLVNATDNDIVYLDSVTDVLFDRVGMTGAITSPSFEGNKKACIKIGQFHIGSQIVSRALTFINCDFTQQNYGIYCEGRLYSVNVIGGMFTKLYRGVSLGEFITNEVQSIKVSFSTFDTVASEGIYVNPSAMLYTHIVSAFNTFWNVGTTNNTVAVQFAGDNSYSMGDMGNIDDTKIDLNGKASFATLPNGRFMLGKQLTIGGQDHILADGTLSMTSTGVIGFNDMPTTVEYSILRDADRRHGTMKISPAGSSLVYDDDYVETGNLGVEIKPVMNGSNIELQYTTTSTGTISTGQWQADTLPPASLNYLGATYGNGIYLTVGIGNPENVATSPDGVNWTLQTIASTGSWYAAAYGNVAGTTPTFVASGPAINPLVYSLDNGVTWSPGTNTIPGEFGTVYYGGAVGNELFVAVAAGIGSILTSPDGIAWTERVLPAVGNYFSIAYGNGTFVLIDLGTTNILTSPDAITWTQHTLPNPQGWYGITFGNGQFVAVEAGDTNVSTSTDGITWITRTNLPATATWYDVEYGNGFYVAIAQEGNSAYSTDGITWTALTLPAGLGWRNVVYGPTGFVAQASDAMALLALTNMPGTDATLKVTSRTLI